MKLSKRFLVSTALLACVVATNISNETSGEQQRDLQSIFNGSRIFCTLWIGHSMPLTHGGKGTEILRCETDNKHLYTVTDVPDNFLGDTQFVSGSFRISVLNSCVYDNDHMKMDDGDAVIVDSNVANGMTERKATRSLIVMRVIDNRGNGPTLSKAEFADKIFGVAGDRYNLVSGYRQCSGDEMIFVPGTYSGATNGVMNLNLSVNTNGMSAEQIETLARRAAKQLSNFNYNSYDHIMYILTPNASNFLAYAYINGRESVFSDRWAATPSTLIHELGHNLGYLHSGVGQDQYGDQSCMMGYSYDSDEGPVMCFNAAKSWYTNWYSTRHADISPLNTNGGADLSLIGIDDFLNGQSTSAHTTVARITGGNKQLFMIYNRQEGVNSEVVLFGGTVNIVAQGSQTDQSWTRAQLDANDNDEYTVNNFGGSGGQLVVKVCETVAGTPDIARTLVYVTSVQTLSCSSGPVAPVTTPVTSPVTTPVTSPVIIPTNPPVGLPTPECTGNQRLLTIEIKTDSENDETNFNLRKRNKQRKWQNTILKKNRFIKDAINRSYICVKTKSFCYRLKVKDKANNGITGGYIRMFRDSTMFYDKEFTNGRKIQKKFGSCKK